LQVRWYDPFISTRNYTIAGLINVWIDIRQDCVDSFPVNPGLLSCIQMAVFAITAEFYNESWFTLMHSDGRVRDYCRVLQWIPVHSHAFRWPCSRLLQSFTMNPGSFSCIQMTVPEIIAHEATVVFNTMNDLMMEVLWFKVEPRNIRTNLRFLTVRWCLNYFKRCLRNMI
jgi:hypothetical protein